MYYVIIYQYVPKLDLQRQLFYGKNHLNLSIFSFNNLGIQIVRLTFYFLRLCTIFVNSVTRLFKKLDNFLEYFQFQPTILSLILIMITKFKKNLNSKAQDCRIGFTIFRVLAQAQQPD